MGLTFKAGSSSFCDCKEAACCGEEQRRRMEEEADRNGGHASGSLPQSPGP